MNHVWFGVLQALGLMAGMLAMLEVGFRIGRRRIQRGDSAGSTSTLDGALFALLGLLLAFTFSGAASRFDARCAMIVQEANDIGTASLVVASFNVMFDIASTRSAATELHPPPVVFGLLFILALACALVAGHGIAASAGRHWLHRCAFAAAMGVSFYVIMDLEYPRRDLIRVDAFDRLLHEVRQGMR